jgi:hypothetical protein
MMRTSSVITALALLTFPSIVRAEDAVHGPGFVTIDRQDAGNRAGAEVSDLIPNNSGTNSFTSLRFDFHGQYVDPGSGAGGYVAMPISYVSGTGNSATGIGDFEVGGIYVPKLSTPNTGLILHAGLTLPTGSTDTNPGLANVEGIFHRITDFYLAIPNGLSVRVGVSPVVRSGQLFARADIGFDGNISANRNADVTNLLRVNAGVGFDAGQFAVMAESSNIYATKDSGTTTGSSWINTGAVSARVAAGAIQPFGALVFPLDHDSHQVMDLVIVVGLDAALH